MISKVLHKMHILSESILLIIVSLFVKRNESYVAIGSWSGERYADNSRYLAEYLHI